MSHTVPTPPGAERLTVKEKVAYSAGQLNDLFMNNYSGQLLGPVYNIALGMPLDIMGYATAIPRLWDAITDPLVGSISDNFRSRWGRRKPFMVVGAVVSALSLFALWLVPPGWGVGAMFSYLVILSILFYTGNTLFLVPYSALGLAMSSDYNERTNLFAYKTLVDTVGGFLVPWAYFIITLDCFDNTIQGAKVLSFLVGLGFIGVCMIPVCLCRERYDVRIATQAKVPLLTGVRESLSSLPFMLLALAVMLMFFGMFTIGAVGFYLNIYYVFDGDEKAVSLLLGMNGMMWKISSLICLPLIVFVSRRIGKKQTFAWSMLLAGLAALGAWWCINPKYPYLQLIPTVFQGPAISCVLLLMNSMMADVCDVDELRTGTRREAMFTAINGWLTKLGITGATAISGVLLVATGFELQLAAAQTPETILRMRLLGVLIPAGGMLLGALLIVFYPLNEQTAAATKRALEARRGQEAA